MPAAVTTAAPKTLEPDAALSGLYAEWQRLGDLWIVEAEAKEPAEQQYEALELARPEALVVRVFDGFGVEHHLEALPNGKHVLVYSQAGVEQLRIIAAPTRDISDGPDEDWVHVPDPEQIARRDEIIAAYDGWVAEQKALADRLGLTAARAKTKATYDAQVAIEARIRATPPVGLAGLMIKAQIADNLGDEGHAWQIVADLLAMMPDQHAAEASPEPAEPDQA